MTDKNERDIKRIVVFGSSLAAGFVAATLQALRPHLNFDVSLRTVMAFAGGMGALWVYWSIILHPSLPGWRFMSVVATGLLVIGGVWAFLYPVKFVNPSAFKELTVGLIAAVCALTGVAGLLLLCKRFFERDERDNTDSKS